MFLDDLHFLHILGRKVLGQQGITASEQVHALHVEIADGLPVVVDVPALAHLHPRHPFEHVRNALVLLLHKALHIVLDRIPEQVHLRGPHHYLLDIESLRLQLHPDVPPVRHRSSAIRILPAVPVRHQRKRDISISQHRHPYRIPCRWPGLQTQLEPSLPVCQRILRPLLSCRHIQHHRPGHRNPASGLHHHAPHLRALLPGSTRSADYAAQKRCTNQFI